MGWSSLLQRGFSFLPASFIGVPKGLVPVSGFDVNRYLGRWYEIARLDHRFERGLSKVTADYSRSSDGSLEIINRGFDAKKGRWKQARGRGLFIGSPNVASFRVSFFIPFWAGYHVIALDKESYNYAMVTSRNRSYLWILAREKNISPELRAALLAQAQAAGFDTSRLIWAE